MNDPLLKPRNDVTDLPKPGEIVIYDYTEPRTHIPTISAEPAEFRVKAVQWNIERAYKLDEIIELLSGGSTGFRDHRTSTSRRINRKPRPGSASVNLDYKDFDVMAIQEFDINCARSDYRNSAQEMARALKMKCIFLCEFEELYSEKLRNSRTQGGGVHGNGLLTWWDVEKIEVIEHVEIFAWEADGEKLNEPRRGKRRSLACFLRHPFHPNQRMIVYSVHLEVFCGIFGRLRQFSQILEHSRRHLATHPHQMILGDLNTMAHGLARFLPKYCCDGMRWRSVGWSEAEWWQRNLFSVTPDICGKGMEGEDTDNHKHTDQTHNQTHINYFLAAHHHPSKPKTILNSCEIEQEIEGELEEESTNRSVHVTYNHKQPIFTIDELKNLINPYFFCPFPVSRSKTVEMHGYSGKLDWMLLRNWRVEAWGLDNEAYCRSDHKLLWTEVVSYSFEAEGDMAKEAHDYHLKNTLNSTNSNISNINSISRIFPFPLPLSMINNKLFMGAGLIGITTGLIIYYSILKKQ